MVKRWLNPQYDRPGSHLDFFLKIQHVHGQKMIDPPSCIQILQLFVSAGFHIGHDRGLWMKDQ